MIFCKIVGPRKDGRGFSLVEFLMAILISGVVMAAIVTVYWSQQRSQSTQEGVAEMQQNLRSAMLIMARDIREAGCDPTGESLAMIVEATTGRFQFTRDIAGGTVDLPNGGDGAVDGPNENITFGFAIADDENGDGIVDNGGVANLGRSAGNGGFQGIASNVESVEFSYIKRDLTIVGVQISLLVRSTVYEPDSTFRPAPPPPGAPPGAPPTPGSRIYTTAGDVHWTPPDDGFGRRFEILTVFIRN